MRPFGCSMPCGSARSPVSRDVSRATGSGVTSGSDGPIDIDGGIRCIACGAPDGPCDEPSRRSSVRTGPGARPASMPSIEPMPMPPDASAPMPDVVSAVNQYVATGPRTTC